LVPGLYLDHLDAATSYYPGEFQQLGLSLILAGGPATAIMLLVSGAAPRVGDSVIAIAFATIRCAALLSYLRRRWPKLALNRQPRANFGSPSRARRDFGPRRDIRSVTVWFSPVSAPLLALAKYLAYINECWSSLI